jgi:putative ABC transport system permease protein
MKFLPLIWKSIWRKKFRTLLTMGAMFIAFVLFGFLMALRMAFTLGIDVAGVDRLVLIHKISLIMPLPISYQPRLQSMDGVELVTHQSWFGGSYQGRANQFPVIAVDPVSTMKIYPEFRLPADQMKAWMDDRQGAVVGRALADRFGWKIGDRIPLRGDIWRPKQGDTWEFNIAGIYDGDEGVDRTQFFFRYDYLDENRQFGQGAVGWYVVKIADPGRAVELSTKFDEMFANSAAETKTTTEKGFMESFAKQIGNLGLIITAVIAVALVQILLVAMIVMAQSVRERTSEIGVLKTLGFSGPAMLAIVLAESIFIAVLGGGLGLLVSWAMVSQGDPTGGLLPIFVLPTRDVLIGAGLVLALGVFAGLLPALTARRLRIVDALRRV